MRKCKKLLPAAAFGLLLIGGCGEQASVQIAEPGVYKGASDPLLEIAGTPEQSARLRQRVLAIQTDR